MPKIPGAEVAGRVSVHLTDEQLAFVLDCAEREQRSVSSVARGLIVEAIDARRARGRKAGAGR